MRVPEVQAMNIVVDEYCGIDQAPSFGGVSQFGGIHADSFDTSWRSPGNWDASYTGLGGEPTAGHIHNFLSIGRPNRVALGNVIEREPARLAGELPVLKSTDKEIAIEIARNTFI